MTVRWERFRYEQECIVLNLDYSGQHPGRYFVPEGLSCIDQGISVPLSHCCWLASSGNSFWLLVFGTNLIACRCQFAIAVALQPGWWARAVATASWIWRGYYNIRYIFWQNIISMSYPFHILFSKKIYLDVPGISYIKKNAFGIYQVYLFISYAIPIHVLSIS